MAAIPIEASSAIVARIPLVALADRRITHRHDSLVLTGPRSSVHLYASRGARVWSPLILGAKSSSASSIPSLWATTWRLEGGAQRAQGPALGLHGKQADDWRVS